MNNGELLPAVRPKRMRSIAKSINRGFSVRLFFSFCLMDVLLFYDELFILAGSALESGFAALEYLPLLGAMSSFAHLLAFQVIAWLFSIFFGVGGIRRKLKPLDQLTDAASFVTAQSAAIDEGRFHDLENAIDSISPTSGDGLLKTGDKELAGLEEAVNKLVSRMRDSYKQQARFVSDASHELRTPIAVIQGYANMLDRWGKEDEKVLTESIEAIKGESEHMKKLVEQLLFLARGDSGRNQLSIENIDLHGMLQEVCEESEMIDTRHEYELKPGTPVMTVGDPDMLKQTARILVENAAKYSPGGEKITLRAAYQDGYATFSVQDNGIGMEQSDVPHVFERFYRADSSRARESGGTGLGLAIAKWIVERHNGWFVVLSRTDVGTRITVFLHPMPEES